MCYGNSDRSPAMAAVLNMYLKNAGYKTYCESAGVGENAAKGGSAAKFAIDACSQIGLNISGHDKRRTTTLDLNSYDLVVCADCLVAEMLIKQGCDIGKIYNAEIPNPWPVKFKAQYTETFQRILAAMYLVVDRYFVNMNEVDGPQGG
ncbi:MAG: hypothetical protein WC631_00815 [Candidatus Paceibacterota bacterium]